MKDSVLFAAFRYSIPVLLGYIAIGVAFGLVLAGAGYPWWLALVMSLWMYAGAGQFIAIGLFAAGTSLWEVVIIQLVVNARHIAYGLSMLKRFGDTGPFKPYLVFSLTDETFALLSSLPENGGPFAGEGERRRRFMFYVALLNQGYWTAGSVVGALAGALITFDMYGIGFALTALFIVLMIEQIKRVKKPGVFVVSGAAALLGVFLLPGTVSLLAALALALVLAPLVEGLWKGKKPQGGLQ
ncbi:MAG: AzlC family ABC transporter permease [Treponema sp.]|nr:AzlC family ABC transporter permease [Treponema sp.]